jgi:hypothetical protein
MAGDSDMKILACAKLTWRQDCVALACDDKYYSGMAVSVESAWIKAARLVDIIF